MEIIARFTQYYLVSIILPGFFNLSIIVFVVNCFKLPCKTIEFSTFDIKWTFILLVSIVLTLLVGMLIEKMIFCCIKFLYPNNKNTKNRISMSFDDLASWRQTLLMQLDKSDTPKSQQLQFNTEKLMSEYYFLNNIIPGIILASLILLVLLPPNVGPITFRFASSIIIVSLTLYLLFLIFETMKTWIVELHKLQKIIIHLDQQSSNSFE